MVSKFSSLKMFTYMFYVRKNTLWNV
uniref:Uncharacterized protein n=1 Tax=Anguilla anguilla TaxID=7936 RepID=A0A0E9TTR1_ANGAN